MSGRWRHCATSGTHTGDGLRRDADGYFYFVDRMRDVIRRRAVNISSFDVETVIGGHPAVAECAVAVPSEFAGGEDEINEFSCSSRGVIRKLGPKFPV